MAIYPSQILTKVQENVNTLPKTELGDKSHGIILSEIRVTPEAILEKLNKLNKGKAQGPDKVPPQVFMELSRELSVPLSILFNKSLEEGKIPSEWKSANVVAILQKGTQSCPGNYRPVSLTCVICKLLESFIRVILILFIWILGKPSIRYLIKVVFRREVF